MKNYLFFVLLFLATGGMCQTMAVNNLPGKPLAAQTADNMQAAKQVAQKRLPEFLDSLAKFGRDFKNFRFVLKTDYEDAGKHEHMWSQVYRYNNGSDDFDAVFIDAPYTVKNVQMGDKLIIKVVDVEDWAIYDLSNKLVAGNFSGTRFEQ